MTKDSSNKNPIISLEKKKDGLFYILEVATKEATTKLLQIDRVDWRGSPMRVQRLNNFIEDYNETKGQNCAKKEGNESDAYYNDNENKLFMGGIPTTMSQKEVKTMLESFGQLKTYNLVKDQADVRLNRGFCFFEYIDDRATERAIKGLNGQAVGENRLKVQKASIHMTTGIIANRIKQGKGVKFKDLKPGKNNFSDTFKMVENLEDVQIPGFAIIPSRVIKIINVVNPEDLMDDVEFKDIHDDIRQECVNYGNILSIEIPRPDKARRLTSPAVGNIFVKFEDDKTAKIAKKNIEGKIYNKRTCVVSFYPENMFDIREFSFTG